MSNIEQDGVATNDTVQKNDSGCCVYVSKPESEIIEVESVCKSSCDTEPSNTCGLTHPKGSGTLAGCKSTTPPHFGVSFGKREGMCREFAYYTSGNTEEYEDECGNIVPLKSEEVEVQCDTKTVYSTVDCLGCEDLNALKEEVDANKAKNEEQDVAIAANVDNTDTGTTVVHDGKVYYVLEDGTEVEAQHHYVDLAGNPVTAE